VPFGDDSSGRACNRMHEHLISPSARLCRARRDRLRQQLVRNASRRTCDLVFLAAEPVREVPRLRRATDGRGCKSIPLEEGSVRPEPEQPDCVISSSRDLQTLPFPTTRPRLARNDRANDRDPLGAPPQLQGHYVQTAYGSDVWSSLVPAIANPIK